MFRVPGSGFVVLAVLMFWVPGSAQEIAPVRPGLVVVPTPVLDDLEPAVADQMRTQRMTFESVAARTNVSARDLAAAYHALGRLCQAYEFLDAAEASYANAIALVPQDVASLHLLGYLYQQIGRFDDAVVQYSNARRAAPNDAVVRARVADVYLRLNRLPEAGQLFQDLIEIFPAVARAGLGEIALREGRFSDAVQQLQAALDRAPYATSLHYSLGMAYRGLGRLEQARSHLMRRGSGVVRPADPLVDSLTTLLRGERAQLMVGRRAYDAGQFDEARVAFSKAVAAAPSSVEGRLGLGMALAQIGNAAGATEQLEQVLRLDPDNTTAHASLGLIFSRTAREREAVDHLLVAFRREPTEEVAAPLTRLLLKLSRGDEALDVLAKAGSVSPDDEGTVLGLSILLADRERFREAMDLLESAHRQFPDRVRTTTTLARMLAASPDRSLRDGARALTLATGTYESDRSAAHGETVAMALAELGRCAEAATWMKRAVADAERERDTATAARLRTEASRYSGTSCRP